MADYSNPSQQPQTPKPTTTTPPPTNNYNRNMNNNGGNNGSAKTLKTITIILAIALLVCLGGLYYVWNQGKQTADDITLEKEQVTNQLLELKGEYAELRTNNDTINAQLSREKQKIEMLLDKIKQTDASNRKNLGKLKEYEKEMGSLRTVLRGYVHQIDSLNNLNQQLRAENTEIKQQAEESQRKVEELSQTTENLKSIVDKGAVIKARDVMVTAINNKGKDVSKTRQVEKIRTCLTLISNNIADKGVRTLYIRIKSPDGSLMTNSSDNLFSAGDSQLVYSAMREIDFQGDDLEVCIFYTDSEYTAGIYNVEVYMDGVRIGTSQMLLK